MPLAYPDTVKAKLLGALDQPQCLLMAWSRIRRIELSDGQEPEPAQRRPAVRHESRFDWHGMSSVMRESATTGNEFTNRRHGRDTMATTLGQLAAARTAAARLRTAPGPYRAASRDKHGSRNLSIALRIMASRRSGVSLALFA